MERTTFENAPCSIARSLDVLGDWWTPLILRECFYGVHRFSELQSWLGISRNILTQRLEHLVAHGLIEKRLYQERPPRHEYHLTERGRDAQTVLLALMGYSERWLFPEGEAPIHLFDRRTHQRVRPVMVDAATGEPIDAANLYGGPGPSFPADESIRQARFAEYYAQQDADVAD